MPKKYRNSNGDMLYIFSWENGGGNTVNAPSKAVARKRAIAFGKGISDRNGVPYEEVYEKARPLVPNMDTLRAVTTFEEYLAFDRALASLCY